MGIQISTQHATLHDVLDHLMKRYQERVPDVGTVIRCMMTEGIIQHEQDIENDHIAFRTVGVPHLGIGSLERIFLHYGYIPRDAYTFPEKKLDAWWYAPPEPMFPRIFISELRVRDLSGKAQRIIHSYTDEVTQDPVDRLSLDDAAVVGEFLHTPLWRIPRWEDYQTLGLESEYAAWAIYNRYYLNHFTITIHNLPDGYNTLDAFNAFLERHGVTLNNAGGTIKVSRDGKLLQSSTVAEMIDAEFAGGVIQRIAGSYVEFAERRPLDDAVDLPRAALTRAHRRDGFEAENANLIFESTYREQTSRQTAVSRRQETDGSKQ